MKRLTEIGTFLNSILSIASTLGVQRTREEFLPFLNGIILSIR